MGERPFYSCKCVFLIDVLKLWCIPVPHLSVSMTKTITYTHSSHSLSPPSFAYTHPLNSVSCILLARNSGIPNNTTKNVAHTDWSHFLLMLYNSDLSISWTSHVPKVQELYVKRVICATPFQVTLIWKHMLIWLPR